MRPESLPLGGHSEVQTLRVAENPKGRRAQRRLPPARARPPRRQSPTGNAITREKPSGPFAPSSRRESALASWEQEIAARFGRLAAAQAAELAVAANVRQLILVHISRRYADRQILHEAQSIFPNTVVPHNLDHYRIARGSAGKVTE